jgi:hypothetical protein
MQAAAIYGGCAHGDNMGCGGTALKRPLADAAMSKASRRAQDYR